MAKLTKERRAEAIEHVRQMLLSGASRFDIQQNIAKKYNVTVRIIDGYIASAREGMQEVLSYNAPFAFAEQISARRHVRKQAVKSNDWRLVLDCLKDEAKMLDLYPSQKHEHNWKQEIAGLVNAGIHTVEEIQEEFGDDLVLELFGNVGIRTP